MIIEQALQALKTDNIYLSGAGIGEQAYFLSKIDAPIFFLASSVDKAYKISEQLKSLGRNNILLDSFDNEFVFSKFQSKDNSNKIINALASLINKEDNIVVTTLQALKLNLTNPQNFTDSIIKIVKGECYNLDYLASTLIDIGYKRVDTVEQIGEFSIRGDIMDIISCNHEYLVRINFFDDEVENIIYYDNINLTRIKNLENIQILPNKTIILSKEEKEKVVTSLTEIEKDFANFAEYRFDVNNLPNEMLGMFDLPIYHIFDYLKNPIVVYQNVLTLNAQNEKYNKDLLEKINKIFLKKNDKNIENKYVNNLIKKYQKNINNIENKCIFIENGEIFEKNKNYFNFNSKILNNYLNNLSLLKTDFSALEIKNKKIKLCLNDNFTINSIKEILFKQNIPFSTSENSNGFVLTSSNIPYNICVKDEDIWYIGGSNFAKKKDVKIGVTKKLKYLPKSGEYVVHDVHGIGLCEGVVTLKVMGADKDFFKILYQKGDVLYVPTENTELLSLYMGSGEAKLNKLGGKEFALTKAKTEKAVKEMAKDLLELYAKRAQSKGFKYSPDNYLMAEFENSFEYTETADQALAIQDIKRDMMSGKVMDRLICGDVGYGKTEVAMRAIFKAFLDGKQTALLAPTTILSLQHYMTFDKRFKDFGVRVEMLNRFKTAKEKQDILQRLKEGKIDVICATHSILADGVAFKDLGLLVLDEEQRFGVKAKEKLKSIKNNVDVITMSATPIPRTLNMAMLTLRDISIINTPPKNRLPVKTYVTPFDIDNCAEAVKNEINRGGQVLIVYNDIDRIYHFAHKLADAIDDERCKFDVAHGKMAKVELENAIKRLYDGKTNVFVSTTLIENGVDLPKANTLIVLDSQNLGLSQLYQLRGRVGRSNEQAFAYFTYPKNKTITIDATNRLEALAENTELGSGFKIAMRDLQLRGAGELLGKEQHGHMVKVGYDMYIRLLEEATKRLKGEKIAENRDVKLDIAISAKVPNDFVTDEAEKLRIYSKISNIDSIETQRQIVGELKNSYGKLPKEVLQLANVALIKALAMKLTVKHITISKNNYSIVYYQENFDVKKVLHLLPKFNKMSLLKSELPTIKLNVNEFSPETAQGYFIEFLSAQMSLI